MIACLDADCTICLVELHALWGPKVAVRIAVLRAAVYDVAVTDLARTECLAGPLHKGDAALIADYQAFFADPSIRVLPLSAAVCERAAHLRAASNFQLRVPRACTSPRPPRSMPWAAPPSSLSMPVTDG